MVRPRIGPGPVFVWEWRTGSRRWQFYGSRVLFGLALLLSIWAIWSQNTGVDWHPSRMGRIGVLLYYAYVLTQLGLIVLVTPAMTAGAICQEKARGSLMHLLVTDLSDSEIVFGKLLARLIPSLMLMAAGVPILMICGLLGGLDLNAVIGATAVTAGVALLCCSGTLLISIWAKKPHGALMAAYFFLLCWLLLAPIGEMFLAKIVGDLTGWNAGPEGMAWVPAFYMMVMGPVLLTPSGLLAVSHPVYLVVAPYESPLAVSLADQVRFLGCTILISGLMGMVSVRALRRVYLRQLGKPPKATKYLRLPRFKGKERERGLGDRGWLPGPTLDGNPVLWREWHRNAPSFAQRLLWHAFTIIAALLYIPLIVDLIMPGRPMLGEGLLGMANGFTVTYGLLLLSVSASTSLSEERARGSLDVLMSTPLPTSQIVWGKWWGTFRGALWISLLPTIVAVLIGIKKFTLLEPLVTIALILSFGAMLTSLGLFFATVIEKQGRAIGLTVAGYGALCFGWPILVVVLGLGATSRYPYFLLEAPWYGSHRLLAPLVRVYYYSYGYEEVGFGGLLLCGGVWVGINALITAALITLTLMRFNHYLGRVDEVRGYAGPVTVVMESGPTADAQPGTTVAPSAARQT